MASAMHVSLRLMAAPLRCKHAVAGFSQLLRKPVARVASQMPYKHLQFRGFSVRAVEQGTAAAATASAPVEPTGTCTESAPANTNDKPQSTLSAYMELSKARLSALVVITSGAGFLLAGHPIDWATCAFTVTGTSLAAAAANTFNQVYEIRTDGLMMRTMRRPLPSSRLTRGQAIRFGLAAAAASGALLWYGTNPLTTALGLGNIALYAGIYTPLKQMSTLNTAVGAIVGAIPPLMGWAAATGDLMALDPWMLAYILFAWQFPHFYALAWMARKDYARGGYHMVPVFDTTGEKTGRLMMRHAVGLALVPLVSTALGVTSPMFVVSATVLNGYLIHLVRKFRAGPSDSGARAVFRTSLWYLPVLMTLLVFHAKMWANQEDQLRHRLDALAGKENSETSVAAYHRPSSLRGIGIGEGIEHAVACTRALGRAWCAHELWVRGYFGGSSSATGSEAKPVVQTSSSGAAAPKGECPIPLPAALKSSLHGQPAVTAATGAGAPSQGEGNSSTGSHGHHGPAPPAVRALCPVVAVEHGVAKMEEAVHAHGAHGHGVHVGSGTGPATAGTASAAGSA